MQFNLQRLPQRNPLVWGYRRNWCKPRSDPEHYLRLTLNEVTSAFVLTAWMVVVVLIGYYLKVYDPRLDPFRKEGTQKATKYPNSIDFAVHEILQSLPWPKHDSKYISAQSSRLGTVLNAVSWLLFCPDRHMYLYYYALQCVLMFADVQIFTSLAILISAYTSVGCDIVAYHWQYMIYLAWLASVTHLASLSFLRNHLANNPAKRTWRLVAMCIIQVMLSVAVGLSMTFDGDPWLDSQGGRPAICYFKERIDTTSIAFQSAIKFIILIVWGLAIRIAKTFEGLEGGLRRIASLLEEMVNLDRRLYLDSTGRRLGSTPRAWRQLFVSFRIGYLSVISIQLSLFTSLLAEVSCDRHIILKTSLILLGRSIGYSLPSFGLQRDSSNSAFPAIKTTANGRLVKFFLSSFSLRLLP